VSAGVVTRRLTQYALKEQRVVSITVSYMAVAGRLHRETLQSKTWKEEYKYTITR